MSRLFVDLKEGLEEIIAYKKGKIKLRTTYIEVPKPPAKYKSKEIKKIREKRKYSQDVFAQVLNVSTKTVQNWESGIRRPTHATLRLLEIVDKGLYDPVIIKKN